MVEGPIKIILSYKEVGKEHLWLRPKLNRGGFDLLYFGPDGWTDLIVHKCIKRKHHIDKDQCNFPKEEDNVTNPPCTNQ